jgi:hypothetical protein
MPWVGEQKGNKGVWEINEPVMRQLARRAGCMEKFGALMNGLSSGAMNGLSSAADAKTEGGWRCASVKLPV